MAQLFFTINRSGGTFSDIKFIFNDFFGLNFLGQIWGRPFKNARNISKNERFLLKIAHFFGDPCGNRTHDTTVKG